MQPYPYFYSLRGVVQNQRRFNRVPKVPSIPKESQAKDSPPLIIPVIHVLAGFGGTLCALFIYPLSIRCNLTHDL